MYSSKEEKFLPIQESMILLVTKCKSCQAEIFWIETPKGKKMPMNIKLEKSQIAITPTDCLADTLEVWGYISHWSTCPLREEFKK